jgi:class 3 adenylate cyclase
LEGTVVASDASGLSRMMKEMELLEVLRLVSHPKEIIYSLGREIGGRAIGAWVADNTEMFYAQDLELESIVEALAEAQARIQERHSVQLGTCVHTGSFYEIGGGLYGSDADTVEFLAEHYAGPGEILVTEPVARWLKSRDFEEGARASLAQLRHDYLPEQVYSVRWNRRAPWLKERETSYPHAFPMEFYELLRASGESEEARCEIYGRWLQERTIVFLARQRLRGDASGPSLDSLLDNLVMNALMDTVIRETMSASDHVAGSAGGVAILTFATPQEGVGFAREIHTKLAENGLPVHAAIDAGPVLLFRNSRGPSGIAGDPVNTASKLAEDLGLPGSISVTERAFAQLSSDADADRFEVTVSGITVRGAFIHQ